MHEKLIFLLLGSLFWGGATLVHSQLVFSKLPTGFQMGCRLSNGTSSVFLEPMEMTWECSQNACCHSFIVSVTFSIAVTSVKRSNSLLAACVPFPK